MRMVKEKGSRLKNEMVFSLGLHTLVQEHIIPLRLICRVIRL